jgi:hypothetical protein
MFDEKLQRFFEVCHLPRSDATIPEVVLLAVNAFRDVR